MGNRKRRKKPEFVRGANGILWSIDLRKHHTADQWAEDMMKLLNVIKPEKVRKINGNHDNE